MSNIEAAYDKYAPNTTYTIPARSSVAVLLRKSQALTVINTHGTQVVDFWTFQTPVHATGRWLVPSYPLPLSTTIPTIPTVPPISPISPVPAVPAGPSAPALPSTPTTQTPETLSIHLSTSHTRASTLHLSPLPGDTLVTNHRTPILKLIQDTSPGIHDTLIPACDRPRYLQLGVPEDTYHANCVDNLHKALATLGFALPSPSSSPSPGPDPLNLFMNVPVIGRGPNTNTNTNTNPTNNNSTINSTAGADLKFEAPVCRKGDGVTFEALVDCIAVMSACPQDLVKVNNMEPTEAHFMVR